MCSVFLLGSNLEQQPVANVVFGVNVVVVARRRRVEVGVVGTPPEGTGLFKERTTPKEESAIPVGST